MVQPGFAHQHSYSVSALWGHPQIICNNVAIILGGQVGVHTVTLCDLISSIHLFSTSQIKGTKYLGLPSWSYLKSLGYFTPVASNPGSSGVLLRRIGPAVE